jgi:hypothetical protein
MKSVAVYISTFFVCLALSWLPIGIGVAALIAFAMALGFAITFSAWWRMIAGGVTCIAIAYGLLLWAFFEKYKIDYYHPTEAREWIEYRLRYAIQMGGFVGGSMALLLYHRKHTAIDAQEKQD